MSTQSDELPAEIRRALIQDGLDIAARPNAWTSASTTLAYFLRILADETRHLQAMEQRARFVASKGPAWTDDTPDQVALYILGEA